MLRDFIRKVTLRENLTLSEAREAMELIMTGQSTVTELAGYLVALKMKGETVEEITGSALAMRAKALPVTPLAKEVVDTCGTGGDGSTSFNISTTAALIVAGAGIPVAKHGNRAVSGRSGSADLLEALGVNLDLTPSEMAKCIDAVGIGFLFAPRLHPAMKHAAGPRRELGIRSIFNLLGPLTNPAGAQSQLIGVYDPSLTETIAGVLQNLGLCRAMVVHGCGGLDEVSLAGWTRVTELKEGNLKTYDLYPEDFGLTSVALSEIQGGGPEENAQISREILAGVRNGRRQVALANAALALVVAGAAKTPRQGVALAARAIDSGRAAKKLEELRAFTSGMLSPNQTVAVGGESHGKI
ncbi:MAG: anthranilate phosphoribosyltransferase [Firmicutes bacterium]|nr:anthranilate phosphoribosyltransferase [Bacillota bacterium]